MLLVVLFFFLAVGTSLQPARATDKCGEVGDEAWVLAGSPYIVTCDVTVAAGTTLRVDAGVEVRFTAGTGMTVDGTLNVNGHPANLATFTSGAGTPQPEDWRAVTLGPNATGNIYHAYFQYAEHALEVGDDVSVTLTGVTFRWNRYGLFVQGEGNPSVHASGCKFIDNTWIGVLVEVPSADRFSTPVTITDSELYNNVRNDIFANEGARTAVIINARHNWWGTTDASAIGNHQDDTRWDNSAPTVDYCDFLDGPGGAPARDVHCPDLAVAETETEVWDQTDKPYLLTSRMKVYGNWEVGPGVEVRVVPLTPPARAGILLVSDGITFSSTAASPAVFTSDSASPQPGDWCSLTLWHEATINHAIIEYASQGVTGHGRGFSLTGVTTRRNFRGLHIEASTGHTVSVTDCTITDNDEYGIYVDEPDPFPGLLTFVMTGSSIHGNGINDFYVEDYTNPTETTLMARDNWWGTTDPAAIASTIYDHNDAATSPIVDWCGFLDGHGGSPAVDAHCPDLAVCGETEVWDQTDKPYLIVSDMAVCPTGTLQVEAGVEARVAEVSPQPGVSIHGVLDVNGTSGSRVTVKSDAPSPQPSDWTGLWFFSSSNGDLQHVVVNDAEVGIYAADASIVALDGVESRLNNYGLRVRGDGPPAVTATNSTFTNNTFNGVEVIRMTGFANPSLTVTDSSIHNNGSWQYFADVFNNPSQTVLDATGNWWGTADTGAIALRIHDHADDFQSPIVDWCGYRTTPGGAGRDVHCPVLYMCGGTYSWDLNDKPYLITSDLYVCPGSTLEISPGVEARFAVTGSPLDFLVEGTLDSNGTPGAQVTLTSDSDAPAADDWTGVEFAGNAVATLDHTTIRYAGDALYAADNAALTLNGVTATESNNGLWVYGDGPPTVNATNCSFVANGSMGVYLRRYPGAPNPSVTINGSAIHSNSGSHDFYAYNFDNPDQAIVNARGNWWGSDDPAAIGPRIRDRRSSAANPRVDWCRYLKAPGGAPVLDAHCPDLYVCGETAVWNLTDKPYQVTTDFRVCPTGTLRVEAGVEVRTVKTTPKPDFLVEGVLVVNGTLPAPVTFASDAPLRQAQDWDGPLLRASSTATIQHAEFLYADRGLDVGDASSVTLDSVTARLNQTGLYVYGAGPPTVNATNSSFVENADIGVYVRRHLGGPNPTAEIHNSSIHSNSGAYDFHARDFENPDEAIVNARDNWWGTPNMVAIGPRIRDHRYSASNPRVDWCGYLSGPGGAPERDVHCPDLVICDETTVWNLADKPYQLVTDLWVCPTGTLQVEAGVDVRMVKTTPLPDFLVEGVFDVNGTSGSPATFGSDAPSPQPQDWGGPLLRASSTATIQHAEFLHAEYGLDVGDASLVTLDSVTTRLNQTGLYVYGSGPPTIHAAGCSFVENTDLGVHVRRYPAAPNPDLTITRSSIHSNSGSYDFQAHAFENPDTSLVWATDNWWGTTDTAEIANRIYDHDDSGQSPRVRFYAFGADCDYALGGDRDGDARPDFEDNCPERSNGSQVDTDLDGMGDACDPVPTAAPSFACDGFDDFDDGWLDADGDDWGDPCDFHPLRADSNPDAPERCDARDNDGDALFASGELTDEDLDFGIACGDCDDLEPEANVCLCELCSNDIDDDCDLLADGADAECSLYEACIVLEAGAEPWLTMHKGACGGATLSALHDVIRGEVDQLEFVSGSVDLGQVDCLAADHAWDRVTDQSVNPNPKCESVPALNYLAKYAVDVDYGEASSGERRETMTPHPACVP
jgi:hypothetical protein